LLFAAVLWLVLAGIDSGLQRLQQPGQPSFGMADLADGLPGDVEDASAALTVWNAYKPEGAPGYKGWGTWYVILDFLLVAAYVGALAGLLLKARANADPEDHARLLRVAGLWPLGLVVLFEVIENLMQLKLVRGGWDEDVAHVAATAALFKWLAIGVTLVLLALVWLAPKTVNSDDPWRPRKPDPDALATATSARRAWAPLRVPLVLVVLFAVALVAPVSDQPPDVLRRWLDGTLSRAAVGFFGLVLALGFATTVWVSARRIVLYECARAWRAPAPWIPILLGLLAAGAAHFFSPRLWGLAAVLLGAGLLSWIAGARLCKAEEWPAGRKNTHSAAQKLLIRRRARALSAAVVAVTGLGCVRAFTEPVYLLAPFKTTTWWAHAIGLVAAAAVAVVGTLLWYGLLRRLDDDDSEQRTATDPRRQEWRYWLVAIPLFALAAATWLSELWVPRAMGAFGVLCLFFAVATICAAEISHVVERQVPMRAFRALGLTRTPAFALAGIWFIIGSAADPGGYHDVRRIDRDPVTPTDLRSAFADWAGGPGCNRGGAAVPMLLVANAGGGIRAAYWTASVVERLLAEGPCRGEDRFAPVFAASGISGGSLGLITVASPPEQVTAAEALGADHLAPSLSRLLFADAPQSLLGFGGPDRAELLERSWEDQNATLERRFSTLGRPPVLLLNGTTVETGCRFSVSQVETGAEPAGAMVPDCRASAEYVAGPAPAVATLDLDDFLCAREDVRRSTAALLSARFPFVSPSGRVEQCGPPEGKPAAVTHVVDGGYLDRTGAAAILDLWRALEPEVEARNGSSATCVIPVFIQIDNTYQPGGVARPAGRREELIAPLATYLAVNANRESAVMTSVTVEFTGAGRRFFQFAPSKRPGVEAPLGWVLSGAAKHDLDEQLGSLEDDPPWEALQSLLRGEGDC
jgi:hypothetical protein